MTLWLTLVALGSVLLCLGFFGSLVPVIPGPLLAFGSLGVLAAFGHSPAWEQWCLAVLLLVGVTVLDYLLPSLCAKKFKSSGWGVFGCFVGTLVGLFFLPFGLVLGPFLGCVGGELVAGKKLVDSLRGGVGALLGYVLCLALKLVAVGLYAAWFLASLPPMP